MTNHQRRPAFHEEGVLQDVEAATTKLQAKDLKVKTKVRMAKFCLRGVGFSCSLVIVFMISTAFTVFNATKALPRQNGLPAWSATTNPWPQILILIVSSISVLVCCWTFWSYCRGGHQKAKKAGEYYNLLAIAGFALGIALWVTSAISFQHQRNSSDNQDLWGWSCAQNRRAELFKDRVNYALLCRLQDWTIICIVVEIFVDVLTLALYSVVVYRMYSKRRLLKSMNLRDKARMEFYSVQPAAQFSKSSCLQGSECESTGGNDRSARDHEQTSSTEAQFQSAPIPAAYTRVTG